MESVEKETPSEGDPGIQSSDISVFAHTSLSAMYDPLKSSAF